MSTAWKIGTKLAVCCVVGGLCLVGWAGRVSIAQSGGQDAPPRGIPGGEPKASIPRPNPEPLKAEPGAPSLADPPDALSETRPAGVPEHEPALAPTNPPAPAPVVVGPDHSPLEAEDPEKVASDFLEHNHKFAEAQLKALKEEAEKLKARLAKVEAGIKRWDRLLEAIKQSEGTSEGRKVFTKVATDVTGNEKSVPRDEGPTELAPLPAQPKGSEAPQTKPADAPGDLVPR